MKIGIDITGLFWKYRTGAQNYYHGLLQGLANIRLEDDLNFVLVDRSIHDVHSCPILTNERIEFRRATPLPWIPTIPSNSTRLFRGWNKAVKTMRGRFAKAFPTDIVRGVDLFHVYHRGRHPAPSAKNVITINDVIPLLFPEWFNSSFVVDTKRMLQFAQDEANGVVAISENTKRDLVQLGVSAEKVKVIHCGVHKIFRPIDDCGNIRQRLSRYGIDDYPYILSVGFLDPRKNVRGHVNAFEQLLAETKGFDFRLVLVGPKSNAGESLGGVIANSRARDRIILTGYIPREELPFIYAGATAFVYCSFYEGFGLPIVEAMACGVPVITSNSSSLAEIAADAALLVDPDNIDQITEAMSRVLTDTDLRSRLIKAGTERAKDFSWEKCAVEHVQFYREVIG